MTQKKIKQHHYDRADGGICIKCDHCTYPHCCPQTEECDGHNWDFLERTSEEWMEWFNAKDNNQPSSQFYHNYGDEDGWPGRPTV